MQFSCHLVPCHFWRHYWTTLSLCRRKVKVIISSIKAFHRMCQLTTLPWIDQTCLLLLLASQVTCVFSVVCCPRQMVLWECTWLLLILSVLPPCLQLIQMKRKRVKEEIHSRRGSSSLPNCSPALLSSMKVPTTTSIEQELPWLLKVWTCWLVGITVHWSWQQRFNNGPDIRLQGELAIKFLVPKWLPWSVQ